MITVTPVDAQNRLGQLLEHMNELEEARARGDTQRKAQRDWATVSAEAWNEFDSRFGSFEQSTL